MKEVFKPWIGRAARRRNQIKKIPNAFKYKTMLYVGANPRRIEMVDMFYNAGYEIDVFEIWEQNVKDLIEWNKTWDIFNEIHHEDIRNIDSYDKTWDVILFWHGPEHLEEKDIEPALKKTEAHAKHLVILGCPYGKYVQDAVDGNEYERHRSYLNEKHFKKLGYNVDVVRKKGKKGKIKSRGSNMVAWKIKK